MRRLETRDAPAMNPPAVSIAASHRRRPSPLVVASPFNRHGISRTTLRRVRGDGSSPFVAVVMPTLPGPRLPLDEHVWKISMEARAGHNDYLPRHHRAGRLVHLHARRSALSLVSDPTTHARTHASAHPAHELTTTTPGSVWRGFSSASSSSRRACARSP